MGLMVLEGLDGSGKGTQARLLEQALSKRPGGVRRITFPDYSSPSSSLVKMYLDGEFGGHPEDVNAYAASTFYAVDRFASFRKDWKTEYDAGRPILADRYATSNFIYQMAKLPREEWEEYLLWAEDLEYVKLGIPRPDLVVYLDMPVKISQKLLLRRYHGDGERKDIHESHYSFLEKCGACARFLAEKLGWAVVPCAREETPFPMEQIHEKVLSLALKILE